MRPAVTLQSLLKKQPDTYLRQTVGATSMGKSQTPALQTCYKPSIELSAPHKSRGFLPESDILY